MLLVRQLALNQFFSETPLKILFQQYRSKCEELALSILSAYHPIATDEQTSSIGRFLP